MKKLVVLTLISSPAFAHQISPQTEFFKEELKKNPLTIQVLNWCNLVGITDESTCQAEMYDKTGGISDEKIAAAKICVEKSGLKYRVALDNYFKVDPKAQGLVGHQVIGSLWHTHYVVDPAEGKDAKPHKHFYTKIDIMEAGRLRGLEMVRTLKERHTTDTTTAGSSLSGTGTLGASGIVVHGEGSVTKGKEDSETKGVLTQAQLDEAYARGKAEGEANPEVTSVIPHGGCYQGGDCFDAKGIVADRDAAPREEAKSPNPKSEAPIKEAIKDFFAPIIEGFSGDQKPAESPTTASVKVEPETPKELPAQKAIETSAEKIVKVKGVETPVHDADFITKLNGCVSEVQNVLIQESGVKHNDPDAKTDEEKKAEAEWNLANGICDEKFYGPKFCADWASEQAETKAENAEAEAEEKRRLATEDLKSGICDAQILGADFCKAFDDAMVTSTVEAELETFGPFTDSPPVLDSNPLPEGGHISIDCPDGNCWTPDDGHKAD